MKKAILLAVFTLGAVTVSQAQTKKNTAKTATTTTQKVNGPEITWENEVMDYGTIAKGSNGAREFKFTNTGNAPLVITSASGSCGCTVPTKPTEPIMPGQTGVIGVKYDTQRVGAFTKTVTVSSNATEKPKTLTIKGTVSAN